MFFSHKSRRAGALLLVMMILCTQAVSAEIFSRTRHKAALLALLCYNPLSRLQRDFSCQRAQLIGLCNMFIQEGGYVADRANNILDINDPEVEHVAMLVRELSGDVSKVSRPGALLLASVVSLGYSRPEISGLRAAMHIGRMNSVDPQIDAVMQAAYSLLTNALEGGIDKKDELLKVAALNTDDKGVAREIRALRLREWNKLPDEKLLLGRFCRALYIWHHTTGWKQAMSMGRKKLRYFESLRFLAVVCAAWEDMPGMPEEFVWHALQEQQIREVCIRLHELADTGVLIYIPKTLVEKKNAGQSQYTRQMLNGNALDAEAGDVYLKDTNQQNQVMASPALPGVLRTPATPAQIPQVFDENEQTMAPNPAPVAPRSPAAPSVPAISHTSASHNTKNYTPPTPPDIPVAPVLAPVDELSDFALPSE